MITPEQCSDLEVIRKILNGEPTFFELLIRRNNPFLYKIGRSYNYSHEDTQDLMQDSFIDAYSNLRKFESRSSFRTWLIKIMLHNCFRRKQKSSVKNEIGAEINEKSVPMFSSYEKTDTNKLMMNRELSHVIEHSLQQIPFDYRMVFSLREINGLNVSETADVLEITEANVKVRLNRAKAMLRKVVEKTYSAEDIFDFNRIFCDAMVDSVMQIIKNLNEQPQVQ